MNKIISVIALSCLMLVPLLALAGAPPAAVDQCTMRQDLTGAAWTAAGFNCPAAAAACPFDSATFTCGSCCLLDTIYTVTNWIWIIITAIALIFIIIGAFTIITAGGNPENVTKGRNYILYAVIGLIVGLAARAIPALVRAILAV